MKSFLFTALLATAHRAASTGYPAFQYYPTTVSDCIEWHNNRGEESCDAVRKEYSITPEEFSKWNPLVDLTCQPWDVWVSYCVNTKEKYDKFKATSSTSNTAATTTTSVFSLRPSPTAWTPKGCYVENIKLPLLDQNMSPSGGDSALTIPKCKNSCYRRAFTFAGVKEGNQCWCGSYIGGEWAKNQIDCNVPCTGDKTTFCGGKGFLNIFQAAPVEQAPVTSIGSSSSTFTAVVSGVKATSTRKS